MQSSGWFYWRKLLWVILTLFLVRGGLVGGDKPFQHDLSPGYPSRSADLDVFPGFRNPPPGYGEIAFYWWLGDTLTRERIAWQMDQLAGKGITGLQINYAHSDTGGYSYGLTYPSQPPLFSEEWWELFRWFLQEAKKRGMTVSLSDYTLGRAGQGWYVDEMLQENPHLSGTQLLCEQHECDGGADYHCDVPENLLAARAYRLENGVVTPESGIDVLPMAKGKRLSWNGAPGRWKIVLVYRSTVRASLDPMNPTSGSKYVEKFFQRFENRCPGESGKGLNFFFSDELDFGIRGYLWNDLFADEFRRRKQYDIHPELPALFIDVGPQTPKIRMDYNDVMVSLSEEHFFKPLYDWHTQRGMLFGCDHGGRGTDVTEFGDYFRTQRWMSGPGCDQPELTRHIIKNKVASSIAHLYERPRTWLEGFHSSNWGTSSSQIADATFANFAMGQNLLSLHGLYYSTHGSWWEWAPPDNHWRQPYWAHMGDFLRCSERLSYVLSQGYHRCDVAIVYPVAPMEAGLRGNESVATAFATGNAFYSAGIDFDFIDFQSLTRATMSNGELRVSGERYRVLILPAMSAVRFSTIHRALEFFREGGMVLAIGALPEASDRVGRQDAELQAMVREIFGTTSDEMSDTAGITGRTGSSGGIGMLLPNPARALDEVWKAFPRDFEIVSGDAAAPSVLHRQAGKRDIYYVYGVPKGTECFFRCKGSVELWNPWNGGRTILPVISTDKTGTRIHMPLTEHDPQLIVFSPGEPVQERQSETPGQAADSLSLDGEWEFELKPTLDNRWGDYRLPASNVYVGAEAAVLRYAEDTVANPAWQDPQCDDTQWATVVPSFGPQFWKLGPLPGNTDTLQLEKKLSALTAVDPSIPVEINGKNYSWSLYEFSWRWGVKGNPGRQGYHGLKGLVHNDLIELGRVRRDWRGVPGPRFEPEPEGSTYYLWSTVSARRQCRAEIRKGGLRPTGVWVNHVLTNDSTRSLELKSGATPVLLRYSAVGSGYVVFEEAGRSPGWKQAVPLASDWYCNPSVLAFDVRPQRKSPVGWYRFTAPPGLRSIRAAAKGDLAVWVNGGRVPCRQVSPDVGSIPDTALHVWQVDMPNAIMRSSTVALRIGQERGFYGGAAIPEPVLFECSAGLIPPGDLSKDEGLRTYAGGMWYRKTLHLSRSQAESRSVVLDLGCVVASVEVWINGELVGTRLTAPWQVDLAGKVRAGINRLEVLVYNTLGNHYLAVPTQYVGSTTSGLLGPVVVRFFDEPF